MTHEDDDPDLAPGLGSMRSVWLGMREEEPPSRGLGELMAAARTQAAAMKPVSWWRRSFAMLVRPPMLAAATVLVVVGGAVMLDRRGGNDASMPIVATGLRDDQETTKNRHLETEKLPSAEIPQQPTIGMGSATTIIPTTTPTTTPTIERPVVRPADPKPKVPPGGLARDDWGHAPQLPPQLPPPPADKGGNGEGLQIAGDTPATTDKPTDKKVGQKAPQGRLPEPAPEQPKLDALDDRGPDVRSTTVSTDQLIKQADTAANRKDCPAVRATVSRIKKSDPEAYKTRVATKPAIARCLK